MAKKIFFIELSTDVVQKIDEHNTMESRSAFISNILEGKFNSTNQQILKNQNDTLQMYAGDLPKVTGEVELRTSQGLSLGQFNINTGRGFDNLSEKIAELSENPMVQMKATCWR